MSISIWERTGTIPNDFWERGKADFPIYDMHGHMGAHNAIYFKRCEAPEMIRHLRRIGVKRLIFSHHLALWGSMRNEAVRDICAAYPDILRMYVAINPHFQNHIREDLKSFDRWRPYAVGLKLLPEYHQVRLDDPRYEYALRFADERHLPVLVHTWGWSPWDGGEQVLKMVCNYPNAIFFLGHCIFGEWEMARRCVLESSGNVYLELTAVPGERGIIEQLTRAVGSRKILFGTDMPWFDEYQAVGGVICADITGEDMRNILYRNAERLLGSDF